MSLARLTGWVEPWAGALLLAAILLDVFLTVLYARAGQAIVSRPVARTVWRLFRMVASRSGRRCGEVMSYCGSVILVAIVLAWATLMTVAVALILHPALGSAVRSSTVPTPTDFVTALYAAGTSVSVIGASDLSPRTGALRLFYLFTSVTGMSVASLTLTYLMQVYGALQARNALALGVEQMSGGTGDAAEMVGRLGPDGRFEPAYTQIVNLAAGVSQMREALHLYPVLFYFSFPEPAYSVARAELVLLDAATLIRTALDPAQAGWLQRSAAVEQLHATGLALAENVNRLYLGDDSRDEDTGPQSHAPWRARYRRAIAVLQRAGVPIRADLDAGAEAYVRMRSRWNGHVAALGRAAILGPEELDPALSATAGGGLDS